jgi:two-component system, NarL family, nitrate/nitrite response regulator NarL
MHGLGSGSQCSARPVIRLAVVDPDRMLLDGLAAWAATVPDLRLVAASTSVPQLLDGLRADPDIVLLGLADLPDGAPLPDVRALTRGPSAHNEVYVLILCSRTDDERIAEAVRAGARGVVTRDNSLESLAALLRGIALDLLQPGSAERAYVDRGATAPSLSEQERAVLLGYASGMTLSTVARRVGIRPSTAKEYLHRVKLKYEQVGRPAYTKIDLANRVREDGYDQAEQFYQDAGTPAAGRLHGAV